MKKESGFTLIETLIAFAIFCLSVSVFYEIFVKSTARTNSALQNAYAYSIAQSLIVRQKTIGLPWEERTSGVIDSSYEWVMEIKVYDEKNYSSKEWVIYQIDVSVRKRYSGTPVSLKSLVWVMKNENAGYDPS
jgi:prepilin-type N-terminal cleavage/methylation domain-containing protein